MAKHTAGPWKAAKHVCEDDTIWTVEIHAASGLIAEISRICEDEQDYAEHIANANLMAKSPELAEALRASQQHMIGLKAYLATCATDVIIDNLETTIAGLREQIAAAEKLLQELGL